MKTRFAVYSSRMLSREPTWDLLVELGCFEDGFSWWDDLFQHSIGLAGVI